MIPIGAPVTEELPRDVFRKMSPSQKVAEIERWLSDPLWCKDKPLRGRVIQIRARLLTQVIRYNNPCPFSIWQYDAICGIIPNHSFYANRIPYWPLLTHMIASTLVEKDPIIYDNPAPFTLWQLAVLSDGVNDNWSGPNLKWYSEPQQGRYFMDGAPFLGPHQIAKYWERISS